MQITPPDIENQAFYVPIETRPRNNICINISLCFCLIFISTIIISLMIFGLIYLLQNFIFIPYNCYNSKYFAFLFGC